MAKSAAVHAAKIAADSRWSAVTSRDPSADGMFVYAVMTTGIYCRPTCTSRIAKPENVCFYDHHTEAEQAGFRPCKRCRPSQSAKSTEKTDAIAEVCRFIEAAEEPPTLEVLAQRIGWSTYHLHRTFKAITGITPRAYVRANRIERVREALNSKTAVTDAIYQAGYVSSGRFYAESHEILGMTPNRYKKGGTDVEIRFAVGRCALGAILVARTERGICAISLGDDAQALVHELQSRFPAAVLLSCDTHFEQQIAQVIEFIESPQIGLDLPLDIRGTAFQQRVWAALLKIPPGQTLSYSEMAELIGAPKSARAVATACAANALAVAIPCHRVVRNDGALSGYRWGVERKRALLDREKRSEIDRADTPAEPP